MKICLICMKNYRKISLHSLFFKCDICHDCFLKMNRRTSIQRIDGVEVYSLFPYDDYLTSLIYQFKGCSDIVLSKVFLDYDLFYLRLKYKGYYVVCAPSFIDHDKKRGFNHVEEIFKWLNLPFLKLFVKDKDFKQSSLNKKERENAVNNIVLKSEEDISNKKILLVDDIITTGSTIKRMIELIKERHPKSLKVLTISYSKSK